MVLGLDPGWQSGSGFEIKVEACIEVDVDVDVENKGPPAPGEERNGLEIVLFIRAAKNGERGRGTRSGRVGVGGGSTI